MAFGNHTPFPNKKTTFLGFFRVKLWDCKVPWPPTHLVVQATLRLSKRDRSTAFTWSSIHYVPIPRNIFNNTNDKYMYTYIYIHISIYIYTTRTWSTNVWGDYNWLILGMLTPVPKKVSPPDHFLQALFQGTASSWGSASPNSSKQNSTHQFQHAIKMCCWHLGYRLKPPKLLVMVPSQWPPKR